MKKIAVFGVKTLPFAGGIETVVEKTVPYLDNTKFSFVIYVRKKYHIGSNEFPNIKFICIPHLNGKNSEALSHTFLSCLHALFVERCDIFFFHAIVLGSLTFLPKLFLKKVILQTHGLDWKREKWGKFAKLFIKFSAKASAIIPDKTICVAKNDSDFFFHKYGKRFEVVPNGIYCQKGIELDYKFLSMRLSPYKYILFMARLVPEKGPHILINAFKKMDLIQDSIMLVIAGDTNYKDEYYKSLLKEESPNIKFVGTVVGQLKQSLLSNALVFVQPSSIEGMSISVLEAMSYGVTTITSDIPENTILIGEYGLSFKKNNSDDLADKLKYFLKNKEHFIAQKPERIKYTIESFGWDKGLTKLDYLLANI